MIRRRAVTTLDATHDAGNLIAEELVLDGNIIDVVVLDGRENATHVADDTILTAVVEDVATDEVRTDGLAAPADASGTEDGFHLVLITWLALGASTHVVASRFLLADTDGATLSIVNITVFNDPALAPVGTEEAWLIGSRRRPRTGGLCKIVCDAARGQTEK